jgi:hypothetical protein
MRLLPWLVKSQATQFAFFPGLFDNAKRCQVCTARMPCLGKQLQIIECAGVCRRGVGIPVQEFVHA